MHVILCKQNRTKYGEFTLRETLFCIYLNYFSLFASIFFFYSATTKPMRYTPVISQHLPVPAYYSLPILKQSACDTNHLDLTVDCRIHQGRDFNPDSGMCQGPMKMARSTFLVLQTAIFKKSKGSLPQGLITNLDKN